MDTALLQNKVNAITGKIGNRLDKRVFGEKVGVLASLFGCWHDNVSRPFVEGKTAYRSCLKCGARKQFDSATLKTHGKFYYPPLVKRVNF